MKIKKLLLAAVVTAIALPPSGSFAQGLALEEIVVTARKRDENIYEIPVSVSSFNQQTLDRAGIYQIDELSALTAGMDYEATTATGGRSNPALRFRGMNQQIITPSTQVGALFWDGSYMGAGGAIVPVGDLERVEVIKGPQTAYFGRNTFTGAVNYIPRMPNMEEWEGNASYSWSPSQHDEHNIQAAVGGPLGDSGLGIRLWAGYDQDGGDFDTQDGEAYAVFKAASVMGTLAYDNGENLRMKVSGYLVNAENNGTSAGIGSLGPDGTASGSCGITYTGNYFNPATGELTPFTRPINDYPGNTFCGNYPNGENIVMPLTVRPVAAQAFLGGPARIAMMSNLHPLLAKYNLLEDCGGRLCGNDNTRRIQFGLEYDISDHEVSFKASRAATGSQDVRDFWFGVMNVPGTVFIVGLNLYSRETFFEGRLTSPQDQAFRYSVGVSDYSLRYRNGRSPTGGQLTPGTYPDVDFQDSTTTAIFGSIDYDFSDALTLSLEARYTDEKSTAILQGNPNRACGASPVCNEVNEYDDFIPRVILSYQPYEGATVYGSYSYSSLLGVATQAAFINQVAPQVIPADQVAALGLYTEPQENVQYELGWKQILDNWAFTFAIFHADWKNQPFASVILLPTGGTTAYRGPGDSKYKGFDFEFQGQPTDWLQLAGTLAYTDTEMTNFSSRGSNEFAVLGSGGLSVLNNGNKARNIPAWTASLSPTILGSVGDRDWFFRTDFSYHAKTWADYSQFNRAPDRFRINARAGINLTDMTAIEIWAKNLTNNKTLGLSGGTTSGPRGSRKAFQEPYQRREVGIRVKADF